MNKLPIIALIVSIITLLLVVVISFASELTIEETKEILEGNPVKIAMWMDENIKGIHDDLGFGQLPKRTFKYKKGDCEDFAILAQYFIGDRYKTYIVVWEGRFREDSKYYSKIWNKKISHAVLAIKLSKNNWSIIDQDKYISGGKTLADIIKINCDMRKINVEKAKIMDLLKLRKKVIEEINLEG